MEVIQTWGVNFTNSLYTVWDGVLAFVPKLIIAIIIFAIGWILAMLIEKIVEGIFRSLKVDAALKSAGMEDVVKRAGYNLNSGVFVGVLVRWFVIVVFLMASFQLLELNAVNAFLGQVVDYLPKVIIAVLILMVAAVVARAMEKVVVASSKAGNIHTHELLGRFTRYAIWIFAIVTALSAVLEAIAPQLIQMVVTALAAGAALAIGLAFGLGGKDAAGRAIERATKSMFE